MHQSKIYRPIFPIKNDIKLRSIVVEATAVVVIGFLSLVSARQGAAAEVIALDVPYMRQERMLCVPTSASMIMALYHDARSPRRLKYLAEGKTFEPGREFSDYSITYYSDLIRGISRIGYNWREITLSDGHSDFLQGIRIIESELRRGHPVMVDLSLPDAHTVVIRGYDGDNRTLLVVDPNRPAPGRYEVGYEKFETLWNEHAFGRKIRGMIVTSPKI